MNSVFKKCLKVLFIVFIIALIGLIILFIKGPNDAVILTPEQKTEQNNKQNSNLRDVNLKGFNTKTIYGEDISSEYFKDYDLTMINLWTVWCSPCIAEMPEISKLYEDKPAGSNIISICVGPQKEKSELNDAKKIIEKCNATFKTLIPDDVIQKQLTDKVFMYPLTIFVDKNGHMVGEPLYTSGKYEDFKNAITLRLKELKSK